MQDTVARALCENSSQPCNEHTADAVVAVAALVLAGYVRLDIEDLIDASSLGTSGAKALRDSVSDEQVQRVLDVAERVRGGQRAVAFANRVRAVKWGDKIIDPAEVEFVLDTRPAPSSPRSFELYRHRDLTGKSGTGVVAWGTLWPDGTVSLRWAGATPSFSNWDNLDVLIDVHGHEGATVPRWLDGGE